MGFDLDRFVNRDQIDDILLCSICNDVLEQPVQLKECEHAFCAECIDEWFAQRKTCPIDRRNVSDGEINRSPRVIKSLLVKLEIKCEFVSFGCETIVTLEYLSSHLSSCNYNPNKKTLCEK